MSRQELEGIRDEIQAMRRNLQEVGASSEFAIVAARNVFASMQLGEVADMVSRAIERVANKEAN